MLKINLLIFELSLLFLLINSLEDSQQNKTIKYLKFPFQRNLTLKDSMTPKQFFETSLYNQIYIDLIVGSNKQYIYNNILLFYNLLMQKVEK